MANKIFEQRKNYRVHCNFTYTGEDNFNETGTIKACNAESNSTGSLMTRTVTNLCTI